ncbi:MAG: Gfo/Idh/MocA family oxidoreductase [Chitinispirillaceae bacterium]|nr:Gfo/Idh/MocA family oxidoreductase [Chitinispirillaceae bacterium]
MSLNFAVLGVGGYIAPRHLKAIRDTGNRLVVACDPNDSVGILDGFSYETSYFREFERFDRHVEKLRRSSADQHINYVTICSPNYLHDAHIRFALRIGADAICEKPLVLNPWNCDALQELERETGRRIHTVLQLRVHPSILAFREKLQKEKSARKHDINLTYITSRGKWYLISWKGDMEKSGGLATNIGIHFFDLLIWLFGPVAGQEVHFASPTKTGGYLELENARVKWFLSTDRNDLPQSCRENNKTTFRSLTIDDTEIEFSEGFADLHTTVYNHILAGNGYGIEDARASIQLAHDIRRAKPTGLNMHSHEYLRKAIS